MTHATAQLVECLAALYPHREDAERIAQQAGLSLTRIRLSDRAIDTWTSLATEADKHDGLLDRLIQIVQSPSEYHDNPRLNEAVAQLRSQPTPPPPTQSAPPNLPNPYTPLDPATEANFVGRNAALKRLHRYIEQRHSVSIVSERKLGKTSLLKTWAQQMTSAGRTVCWLNGDGAEGQSHAAFVQAITGRTAPDEPDAAADVLKDWALQHERRLPGLPPIIIVDDFHKVIRRFDPRFGERLRGVQEHVIYALSSHKTLDQLYTELGRTSPFGDRMTILPPRNLTLLTPQAARQLTDQGLPWFGPEGATRIYEWAGRHPFYIQLLGWHLIEAHTLGETQADALDSFRVDAFARLQELWLRLPEREKEALQSLRRHQPIPGHLLAPLQTRGLLSSDGSPFANVLLQWLNQRA